MPREKDEHTIDCKATLEKLYCYLDGEMEPLEETEFETHLAECIYCLRRYGFELQFRKLVIAKLNKEEVPYELVEKIRIALRSI